MRRTKIDDGRMLEGIGVTDAEEATYRFLLKRPGASVSDVARSLGVVRRAAQEALASLERKGLVNRSVTNPAHFVPAPPEVAVEALIIDREKDLEMIRLAASEMAEEYRASRLTATGPLEVVEVVMGREAVLQRFGQLQMSAREQMRVFDRPPYVRGPVASEQEIELLDRGIRCRALYDAQSLEAPGQLESLRTLGAAGEEARTMVDVPMKLAIADESLAFIPLSLEDPGMEGALLVHRSPLLAALSRLFETLWDRAVQIDLAGAPVTGAPGPGGVQVMDRELVALLAAGLKDQAIARQLGVAPRTVLRRVGVLMQRLEARTRFQAGWLAATRDDPRGVESDASDIVVS